MSRLLSLKEAAEALKDGDLVGVPTETVYGLAANALEEKAVAKIFAAKNRPLYNPIISHFSDAKSVFRYGIGEKIHKRLARFWPGPLTMLLEHEGKIPPLVCANLPQAAFRVPDHSFFLRLIKSCGFPLAAPSANSSGRRSPTTAQMVLDDLGDRIAGVVDGGSCRVGVESTVVRANHGKVEILRAGGLSCESLTEAGFQTEFSLERDSQKPLAPGRLSRHYAPDQPMVLLLADAELLPRHCITELLGKAFRKYKAEPQTSCYIAFGGEKVPSEFGSSFNLSVKGEISEAARNFFQVLERAGRQPQVKLLVSHLMPNSGLGRALNDRLKRGSSLLVSF